MNKYLISGLATTVVSLSGFTATVKPNIVVFLIDDMGLMDTSVPFVSDGNGQAKKYPLNNFYRTPAMEKLASQGVRFSRFYANSVCSPTRATILTGQSSARNHVTQWINPYGKNAGPKDWNWDGPTEETVTLPKLMQQAGYRTIHCGKAHFGPVNSYASNPLNLGFDVNIAGRSIGRPASYLSETGYGKGDRREVRGLDKYHNTGTFLTEALTLEANAEVEKSVKMGKPFYLYMAHYGVHSPFNVDKRFIGHYKDSGKSKSAQAYATLIEGIDKSLNDLIVKLNALGVADNTIIMFLGDNGSDAPMGNKTYSSSAPFRGKKGNSYDGGMRVPFIASWAKVNPQAPNQKKFPIKPGFYDKGFASAEDIFPTVLDYAGAHKPKDYKLDGFSLTSSFASWEIPKPQHFLMHFPHSHRSSDYTVYLDNDWKLIYNYSSKGEDKMELFNLKKDPFETTNVASQFPEKLQEMKKKLITSLDDAGAQYRVNKKTHRLMKPKL